MLVRAIQSFLRDYQWHWNTLYHFAEFLPDKSWGSANFFLDIAAKLEHFGGSGDPLEPGDLMMEVVKPIVKPIDP